MVATTVNGLILELQGLNFSNEETEGKDSSVQDVLICEIKGSWKAET